MRSACLASTFTIFKLLHERSRPLLPRAAPPGDSTVVTVFGRRPGPAGARQRRARAVIHQPRRQSQRLSANRRRLEVGAVRRPRPRQRVDLVERGRQRTAEPPFWAPRPASRPAFTVPRSPPPIAAISLNRACSSICERAARHAPAHEPVAGAPAPSRNSPGRAQWNLRACRHQAARAEVVVAARPSRSRRRRSSSSISWASGRRPPDRQVTDALMVPQFQQI